MMNNLNRLFAVSHSPAKLDEYLRVQRTTLAKIHEAEQKPFTQMQARVIQVAVEHTTGRLLTIEKINQIFELFPIHRTAIQQSNYSLSRKTYEKVIFEAIGQYFLACDPPDSEDAHAEEELYFDLLSKAIDAQ